MTDKSAPLLWIAFSIFLGLALLYAVLPRLLVFVAWGNAMSAFRHSSVESSQHKRERARLAAWQQMGVEINPLLFDYYNVHPDRFSFPYGDDEAQIDGFAKYAQAHGVKVSHDVILDPWGDPVRYVVDHDRDMVLRARGQFYAVGYQRPDRIAVGLLLRKPERVFAGLNEQWSLEGGYLPTK
jgi:hypothetical protein